METVTTINTLYHTVVWEIFGVGRMCKI